jgi:hypothetical protein
VKEQQAHRSCSQSTSPLSADLGIGMFRADLGTSAEGEP